MKADEYSKIEAFRYHFSPSHTVMLNKWFMNIHDVSGSMNPVQLWYKIMEQAMLHEVILLRDGDVSQAELDDMKNTLKAKIMDRLESMKER